MRNSFAEALCRPSVGRLWWAKRPRAYSFVEHAEKRDSDGRGDCRDAMIFSYLGTLFSIRKLERATIFPQHQ